MEIISNRSLLDSCQNQYPIQQYFSFDINPYLKLVRFKTDEFIIREGIPLTHLYYMVEGIAKLYKTHKNGKVSLINYLKGPCFLGEMEILDILDLPKGIQAQTTCTCFQLSSDECKEKVINDIKFVRHICLFLGEKSIRNMQISIRNQVYPLANRLADFILMTEHNGLYTEKHTEVSAYLGVTYRHLLYVLSSFCKDGILRKTQQGYMIYDRVQLEKLSSQL